MTAKKIHNIEKDYKSGLRYKDIEKKHKISHNELRKLIKSQKWTRKSNRSEVAKDNKNAVTTGEFEIVYKDVLDEDELEIFNKYDVEDEKNVLVEQIKILTIRENRMLKRIRNLKDSGKDLTIQTITRNKSSTTEYGGIATESSSTYAESTVDKIQRIEEALTRVQDSKRKCLESLHKFKLEDNRFELELLRLEREIESDEPSQDNEKNNNSLIEALNIKAKEVWTDDIS